ncbi:MULTISPECIES: hypothetical protein [Nonlabens]|uniref:Uncharacterized protein n=1 Tax=Nonlabens xylanidelens TaxID=191564 RepID=A0A2S6ID61_9FLAO|nr:hypothetical protein [Nonlabens xylanidelens]PPK92137.1 hypothetical protein LY01_03028 [Nonlabens xylanidelens]
MNNYYTFLFFCLFLSCDDKNEAIDVDSITVESTSLFFSRELGKKLIITNSEYSEIDSNKLRDNVDGDCNSYLFDEIEFYNLIDCDGKSYFIIKKTGEIQRNDNHKWGSDLPENYLGGFYYNRLTDEYNFKFEKSVEKSNVYKYGGNI